MSAVVLFFVVLFALLAWVVIRSMQAWRVKSLVLSGVSPDDVARVVDGSFSGLLWARVNGRGDLNYRRRIWGGEGAVLSCDISDHGDGTIGVDLWMSYATTQYGIPRGGEKVQWKKEALARKLRPLSATVPAMPATPSAPGPYAGPPASPYPGAPYSASPAAHSGTMPPPDPNGPRPLYDPGMFAQPLQGGRPPGPAGRR